MPGRILYTWADVYSQQLQSGNGYHLLRPTYAIWLLAENLLLNDPDYIHAYKLLDNNGRILTEHGGIWLLELEKFTALEIETEQQRWLQFFKYAGQFDDPATIPEWMATAEMRQAMNTLRQFSEKERNYHAYQARQNYLRQQRAIQEELEEERQGRLEALREKEAALLEVERLKAMLAAKM